MKAMDRNIEESIAQKVAAGKIVGLALAVIDGERIEYARGFGHTSVEPGAVDISPDTVFAIGSLTKVITATVAMCLVEQGVLDLDQPVVEALPGFAFSDAVPGWRVTLRHILSHTSGLPGAGKDQGPRDADALRR